MIKTKIKTNIEKNTIIWTNTKINIKKMMKKKDEKHM